MVLAMRMMMVHSFQSFVLLTHEQLLCAVMPQCGGTRALDVAPDKVSAVFHQRQWQCCWRQCHSCWWQFVVWIDGKMAKQWKLKVLSFAPPFYGRKSSQLTCLPLQSVLGQVLLTDWHWVHLVVRRKMTFWCWASTKLCNCHMLSRCQVHIACIKDVYCMLLRRRFVLQLVARQNCQRLSKCQWHIACVKQCHCNSQQGTKVLVDCLAWCLAPDRSIIVFPQATQLLMLMLQASLSFQCWVLLLLSKDVNSTHSKVQYCLWHWRLPKAVFLDANGMHFHRVASNDTNRNSLTPLELIVSLHVPLMLGWLFFMFSIFQRNAVTD